MQKFTRSLTREIEIGGERVGITLDANGVTLKPVGSRRPPHTRGLDPAYSVRRRASLLDRIEVVEAIAPL